MAARAISIIAALISVPLTLAYLGSERYGMWMTITSLTAGFGFADFGLGSGLLNQVTTAHAKDDRVEAARAISNTFFLLSGAACIIFALLMLSRKLVMWEGVFNVKSFEARAECGPAVIAFALCFLLSLPLGVVQRVHMAYQEGYATNLWQILGGLIGLCGLFFAVKVRAGLPWLIVLTAGGPIAATLLNWMMLFELQRPWLRPSWRFVEWNAIHRAATTGGLFFVIQLLGTVSLQADTFVIAHFLGQAAVTEYSVMSRSCNLISTLPMLFIGQLWPAYGEAFVTQDFKWIRRTISITTCSTVSAMVIAFTMLLSCGHWLFGHWLPHSVGFSIPLATAMGSYTLVVTSSHPCGIFLLATNSLKFIATSMALVTVTSLAAKIIFVQSHGLIGLAWANGLPYLLFATIPGMMYTYRLLRPLSSSRSER